MRRPARLWRLAPLPAMLLLSGCNGFSLINPAGPVGLTERNLIFLATILMLIVVVPVIVLTIYFAWRYRSTNTQAVYTPDWGFSRRIELGMWLIPCCIVAVLATVTWISAHDLDPYKPIDPAMKPVRIETVSMDWKWLFIYPDLHIATVNQVVFPKGVPVAFDLTSNGVMNSFFIPQLGGQIYTMAGMKTKLHLIASRVGSYNGLSANFSGGGFSGMHFKALAMTPQDFRNWVQKVRKSGSKLDVDRYMALSKPSKDVPVTYFSSVKPDLFHDILHQCFVGGSDDCLSADASARR
ncbi:MAG: ubiquinol oxidase subunit II [Rhizobiaceae bacterium]|nr:MAG: ubiquinol oxidase subunit II [Rhizobiaceae bacterium]